jgi:hypothetical protein
MISAKSGTDLHHRRQALADFQQALANEPPAAGQS